MTVLSYSELEYPDDGFGEPDYSYDPVLVEVPDEPSKKTNLFIK